MFLGALVRRAQHSIDSAIGNAVTRALVAIPFLVAVGFLTVAARIRLSDMYGAEIAYIILAGAYAFIGLIGLAITNARSAEVSEQPAAVDAVESEPIADASSDNPQDAFSGADRELLVAALTSAAPVALPSVVRLLYRNLPVVLALLAAVLVFLSSDSSEGSSESAQAPAE